MTNRERFIGCILGDRIDRVPFQLFWGPWVTARKRWLTEGLGADIADFKAQFGPDPAPMRLPVNIGPCPTRPRQTILEDEKYVVFTDGWGIRRRDYKGGMSMSEFMEFPVKNRKDWERYKEVWLDPDDPRRLDGDWRQLGRRWMDDGQTIQIGGYPNAGIFGPLRWLLGDEECLLSFCTDPQLVHDIMNHMTDVYLAVLEKVCREVRVDVFHFFEDMCGRQGPLISPKHWDEFLGPCYRRIKKFADEHGISVISVDTDGMPDALIPVMLRAGVNYLWPFEVAAGCDVSVFRDRYPTLGMMGGIDKRALASGPQAIDRELERIMPAVRKGRYIPDLDHTIPDDVSWQNYCHFARRLKELLTP